MQTEIHDNDVTDKHIQSAYATWEISNNDNLKKAISNVLKVKNIPWSDYDYKILIKSESSALQTQILDMFNQMQEYLSKCLFTVVPSEWYDNLPNTILESYAMHKCVVATNVGSLTENILDGETGLLFKYKDAEDLRLKITYLFEHPEKAEKLGENARRQIDTKFSIENHVKSLIKLFEEVVVC